MVFLWLIKICLWNVILFFLLEHISLFLQCPWFSVSVSVCWLKQPPLPWQGSLVLEMNMVNQPCPCSGLSLHPLWWPKLPSLFLVTPAVEGAPDFPRRGSQAALRYRPVGSGPSGRTWECMWLGPLQGETKKWAFLPVPSLLGLGI